MQSKNRSSPSKLWDWMGEQVTNSDMFGIPISLTYKGNTVFKTKLGGMVSLIATIIIYYYTIVLFKMLVERGGSTVSVNSIQTDLTYDPIEYNIGKAGFGFGIALVHSNGSDILQSSSLVSVSIQQVNWYGSDIGDGHSVSSSPLSYSVCEPSDFENLNYETLNTLKVFTEYYWPDDLDYSISGNLISTNYNYVKITVSKWSGQTYCDTESNIDDVLKNVQLRLGIANSYFDTAEYGDPIKYYYDDELRWKLMPGFMISKYVSLYHIL